MLFEMIASAELFAAVAARIRSDSRVDSLVSGQFFVSGEGFVASVALEWSFTSMCSDVRLQLAVVGELGDIAVRALELLWSLLLGTHHLGSRFFGHHPGVFLFHQRHGVGVEGSNGHELGWRGWWHVQVIGDHSERSI